MDTDRNCHVLSVSQCVNYYMLGQECVALLTHTVLYVLSQIDHISRMPHAAGGFPHGRTRLPSEVWQL